MASGTNGPTNYLWDLRVKINTPDGGLNWGLKMANIPEATAITQGTDICNRLRSIMPSTCEIFHATLSRSNAKKDSRLIPGVIGNGLYSIVDEDTPASVYNLFNDAILVRFEDVDGEGVSIKIGPVPDAIIVGGSIPVAITGVTDGSVAPAASAAQPVTYNTEFTKLMQAIAKYCVRVKSSTNISGGTYDYFAFTKANVVRACKKKGGRVFTK